MFPGRYTLYGSPRSFLTAKVEAMLRFLEVPYDFADKQPHDGSEIEKRASCGAIPLLQTPEDWVIWDSTPIAELLDGRFRDRPLVPRTPVQRIGAKLLEDWFEEWFTRPAMYTRWNFPESWEAVFGGGVAQALLGKSFFELGADERAQIQPLIERMEPFRELMGGRAGEMGATTLEKGRDIPEWFGAFLDDLGAHLEHHPFLLGGRPCVADFSIAGGFRAHFAYDPWPRRFVEERRPETIDFAQRCWDAKWSDPGSWLPDDRLPPTWAPLFAEMEARYVRYLVTNREALAAKQEWMTLDLGFGDVDVVPVPYRELSRLDIRDEFLRLDEPGRRAVRDAVPPRVLDAYLLPPLGIPELRPNKGVFPIGMGALPDAG